MKIKNKKEFGIIIVTVMMVLMALAFVGWWAWKYYCLPEYPDTRDYDTIEERAEKALAFAERHHMNTHYAMFVDYSVPSGTPRLYVWDFTQNKIIARTYVMHGPGEGSTDRKPVFSNIPGSNCSSLGRFKVTKFHGTHNRHSYRMAGLDIDNQTAFARGLMVHSSSWVDTHCWMKHIPLHPASCMGCVTVSTRGMDYLEKLIKRENKSLLLWNYCSKKV